MYIYIYIHIHFDCRCEPVLCLAFWFGECCHVFLGNGVSVFSIVAAKNIRDSSCAYRVGYLGNLFLISPRGTYW